MTHANRSLKIFLVGIGLTLILAGLTPLLLYAQDDELPTLPPDDEAFFEEDPTLPPDDEAFFEEDPTLPPDDDEAPTQRVTPTVLASPTAEPTAEPTEPTPEATPEATEATPTAERTVTLTASPEAAATAEGTLEAVYTVSGEPVEVTGNNSYCMVCHNQPWDTVTLPDGSIQNLFVNPSTIAASVHGENSSTGTFGCIDCHGADIFPHNAPSPIDDRAYTLDSVSICADCHVDEVTELVSGLHEEAILAGNREAAVCTDCHGAHDVQPVVEEPELIAGVCGECHVNTLVEWRASAHIDIGPLGCATCHSPHSQRLRAGETGDELCMNCHDDVGDLFVHEQHLTSERPVACTECHMYTDDHPDQINVSTTERPTGHSMLLDTTPCNTCHEELVLSGEWAQLVADRAPAEPVAEVPRTPDEAELVAETTASDDSLVQLLQGLILGLGFGATVTAVFVARGNRPPAAPVQENMQAVEPPPTLPISTDERKEDETPVEGRDDDTTTA